MNEPGLVIARFRSRALVEARSGEVYECRFMGRRLRPVVGDTVAWRLEPDGAGILTAVQPRVTALRRLDARGRPETVAANLSQLFVVLAPQPPPDWFLLDRYLCAAELAELAAMIVFNKMDLADAAPERLDTYRTIGYPVALTSAMEKTGLEPLEWALTVGGADGASSARADSPGACAESPDDSGHAVDPSGAGSAGSLGSPIGQSDPDGPVRPGSPSGPGSPSDPGRAAIPDDTGRPSDASDWGRSPSSASGPGRPDGLDCAAAAPRRARRSALIGQSGTGKSSLVNALLGERVQRVDRLSARLRQGRHTTTTSVLHRHPLGGEIIDSPGVRNYVPHIGRPGDVQLGFREFAARRGRCRFDDCTHRAEPDCAVKAALDTGRIDAARYENYERIHALTEAARR